MSIRRRATHTELNTCTSSSSDLSYEELVHVLNSADVARRRMLIAKRGKWQFVVKTCR